jgi:hypothetical protein
MKAADASKTGDERGQVRGASGHDLLLTYDISQLNLERLQV